MNGFDFRFSSRAGWNLGEPSLHLLFSKHLVDRPKTVGRLRMIAHVMKKVPLIPYNPNFCHSRPSVSSYPMQTRPKLLGSRDLLVWSHRGYPYSGSLVKVGRFAEVFRHGKDVFIATREDSEWGNTLLEGDSLEVVRRKRRLFRNPYETREVIIPLWPFI